jgi:hypothetical protein
LSLFQARRLFDSRLIMSSVVQQPSGGTDGPADTRSPGAANAAIVPPEAVPCAGCTALPRIAVRYELRHSAQVRESEVLAKPNMFTLAGKIASDAARKLTRRKQSMAGVKELPILDGLRGVLRPGRPTLIISAPGGGASSLLRLLSGREELQRGRDQISYNGTTQAQLAAAGINLKRLAAFTSDVETHEPLLTVQETFQFAYDCLTAQNAKASPGAAEAAAAAAGHDAQALPRTSSGGLGGTPAGGGSVAPPAPAYFSPTIPITIADGPEGSDAFASGVAAAPSAGAQLQQPTQNGNGQYQHTDASGAESKAMPGGFAGGSGGGLRNRRAVASPAASARATESFSSNLPTANESTTVPTSCAAKSEPPAPSTAGSPQADLSERDAGTCEWCRPPTPAHMLRVLDMEEAADTLVGSNMIRGISGGQRRRTTSESQRPVIIMMMVSRL